MKISNGAKPNVIALFVSFTLLCTPAYAQSPLDIPSEIDPSKLITIIKGNQENNPQQEDIPDGGLGYLFSLGTGPVDRINVPPIMKITNNYQAGWSAGLGYSCGKFDPFANVEQMVNQAVNKFKQMPQQFVSAAQGAVAALPAYVLNKINPTLYNTVTKNLDDAFELFDFKVKSCKELENSISNHGNSYFDYYKAAKADRQRVEISKNDGSETVDEMDKKVEEGGADNGIVVAGGKRKGGKDQDPFNATSEIVVAGYNMLIGRTDTTDKSPASNTQHPITKAFKSPADAEKWVISIYGNREWSLPNDDSKTQSKSGVSMRYQYQAHRYHILELMHSLVKKSITPDQFYEKTGGIQFAPSELSDIRLSEPYVRDTVLMLRSQEEAIRDMQQRLRFVKDALLAGLEEPSIAQSTAASKIRQEIGELIGRIDQNLYELNVMKEQG